jgi:hypothetical protein
MSGPKLKIIKGYAAPEASERPAAGYFFFGRRKNRSAMDHAKFLTGFTVIETFVAITILLIAVLGPMELVVRFYVDSAYAKNQIAAAFLAQDGLETIQNIIRNNTEWRSLARQGNLPGDETIYTCFDPDDLGDLLNPGLEYGKWLYGLDNCLDESAVHRRCRIDSQNGSVAPCTQDNCPVYLDQSGFYTQAETPLPTIFWRDAAIKELPAPNTGGDPEVDKEKLREAVITVRAGWTERGAAQKPVVVKSLIVQNLCP